MYTKQNILVLKKKIEYNFQFELELWLGKC